MKDIIKGADVVDWKALVTPVSLVRSDEETEMPYADPT